MRRRPEDLSEGLRTTASFPLHLRTPSRVRAFVKKALAGAWPPPLVDTAVLLASELATNAIVHARTPVGVSVIVTPATVRVEVDDGAAQFPVVHYPTASEPGGRGLGLVASLADEWGVDATAGGKRVWFAVTR